MLFWLVDCERGTTVTDDIEIIKQFKRKKVFIFNKADKKGYQESEKIVENAARVLYKEFPQDEIIDIIAFSTLDNKIYYSKNKKTLSTIVTESKKEGNGLSELNNLKEQISKLFDDEIDCANINLDKIKEDYKENVAIKNERESHYRKISSKDNDDGYITNVLRYVMVDSYDEVLKAVDNINDANQESLNAFSSAISEMIKKDKEMIFTSLTPIINKAVDKINSCYEYQKRALHFNFAPKEFREDLLNGVKRCFADISKEHYNNSSLKNSHS